MHIPSRAALPALAALACTLAAPAVLAGSVFTSSNAPAGNALLVYATDGAGGLQLSAQVPTGGLGTGAGLGSQGAVALSGDGRYAFVVNAASNTVSTFMLGDGAPVLASVVDAGGLMPSSVSEHEGLVAVLDAGGAGNVAMFRNAGGTLQPVGMPRGLSAAGGTGPAEVAFAPRGDAVVVTEKATNHITSYRVGPDGGLGRALVATSAGATPFGFAFDARDHLVVSEAQGGAALASSTSSYRLPALGAPVPQLVSAAVPTTQTAACWIAITPDSRYAYAANFGSDSVSSYRVGLDGALTLAAAVAGSTGTGAGALDLAVSADGRALYAIAPNVGQVVAYAVSHDGSLARTGAGTGLPAGAAGLAAD